MINEIIRTTLHFPPSKNRKGDVRKKYDEKIIILVKTDLVDEPCIITSDLHGHTQRVFNLLDSYFHLNKFTIICAGDMAGTWLYGTDGDPTEQYEFMLNKCGEFYFVQGNMIFHQKMVKIES